MGRTTEKRRNFNAIVGIIWGLMFIVCSFAIMSASFIRKREFDRQLATPLVQEAGELQAIGSGSDVVIVGSIDPETPASAEGLAIYHYLTRGSVRREWDRVYFKDHKPAFELLLGNQAITIQSEHAGLRNTQEVRINSSAKHSGFAPGDRVTVFGTVISSNAPFEVQASTICGGDSEECLEGLSIDYTTALIVAALFLVVGGGFILAEARKIDMSPNEPTASE